MKSYVRVYGGKFTGKCDNDNCLQRHVRYIFVSHDKTRLVISASCDPITFCKCNRDSKMLHEVTAMEGLLPFAVTIDKYHRPIDCVGVTL